MIPLFHLHLYLFSQNLDMCFYKQLQGNLESVVFILDCEDYGFYYYTERGEMILGDKSLCHRIAALSMQVPLLGLSHCLASLPTS